MLDEALEYLEKRAQMDATFDYEVIVVSDGSKDSTVQVALSYAKKYTADKIRVLELIKNRGKGGAVRLVSLIFVHVCSRFENNSIHSSIDSNFLHQFQFNFHSKLSFVGNVKRSRSSIAIR